MKIYSLYIATGMVLFWVALFLFGNSAGFSNHLPILAVFGGLLLFSVASPGILVKFKAGIVVAVIACVLALPFAIGFLYTGIRDEGLKLTTIILLIPLVLLMMCVYFSLKAYRSGGITTSRRTRIILIAMPIILSVLYFAVYGQYWDGAMFDVN